MVTFPNIRVAAITTAQVSRGLQEYLIHKHKVSHNLRYDPEDPVLNKEVCVFGPGPCDSRQHQKAADLISEGMTC